MEIWEHLVDRPGEGGMLNDCANFARTCRRNHGIGWPYLYEVDAQSPRPIAMAFGAANGRIPIMEKALASGADVNQLTDGFQKMADTDDEVSFDEYAAPLHFAAKNDECTAAEWLLAHGADVKVRTRDGVRVYLPGEELARAGYPEAPRHGCMQPQHVAVLFGNLSMLKLIMTKGEADPSSQFPYWMANTRAANTRAVVYPTKPMGILQLAIFFNHHHMLDYIVGKLVSARVNTPGSQTPVDVLNSGWCPFHYTAWTWGGNPTIATLARLGARFDVEIGAYYRAGEVLRMPPRFPLTLAIFHGNLPAAISMMETGACRNFTKQGMGSVLAQLCATSWSAISGRRNDLFGTTACRVPMPPMAYFRAFSTSDRSGTYLSDKARLLRLLLARNKAENLFNVNSALIFEKSMLTYLVQGSRYISSPEMVRDLLDYGADPDWQGRQAYGSFTALHSAVTESVLYHDASKFRIAGMQVTDYAESLLRPGPGRRPASLTIENAKGHTPLGLLHNLATLYLAQFRSMFPDYHCGRLDFDLLSPYELNTLSVDPLQRVKRAIMFIRVLSRVAREEGLITAEQYVDHLTRAYGYHKRLLELETQSAMEKLRLDKVKHDQIKVKGNFNDSERNQRTKTLSEELYQLK